MQGNEYIINKYEIGGCIEEWLEARDSAIKHSTNLNNSVKNHYSGVAMAARTSYTLVGEEKEINYRNLIKLHNRLLAQDPPHSSPLEHCRVVPTKEEYNSILKGQEKGWFRNYKGFKSYRQIIEENGKA